MLAKYLLLSVLCTLMGTMKTHASNDVLPEYISDSPYLEKYTFTHSQDDIDRFASEKNESELAPFIVKTNVPHALHVINDGLASLELRLQLISQAKTSINFETFILDLDKSQRIFLQMLLKKAKEGVKVRMLIDHPPVYFFLSDPFIRILEESGIEVKLYNLATPLASRKIQFRNHKKTLSVDGKYALIGGRNHGDSYFSMSHTYNYIDRDLLIQGPLVGQVDEAFDLFWNHKISTRKNTSKYEKMKVKNFEKFIRLIKSADEFFKTTKEDIENRKKVREIGGENLENALRGVCQETTFTSDLPGIEGIKKPMVHQELFKRIKNIKSSLLIDSPYFVHVKEDWKILESLLKEGKKIETFLNSYAIVSDSFLTLNYHNHFAPWWAKRGLDFFVTNGSKPQWYTAFDDEALNARWGTHSKSYIFDEDSFMVGSYNFDPRSKYYSAETAIFCDNNPEMTASMIETFEETKRNGLPTDESGRPPGGYLQGLNLREKIIYHLQTWPAIILKIFI